MYCPGRLPSNLEICDIHSTLLTKTTAARNEVALSYHNVRGLYFLAVIFVGTILYIHTILYNIYKLFITRMKLRVTLHRVLCSYINVATIIKGST